MARSQPHNPSSPKQIVFLSGLPRTGSTLLNSIVSQNPDIYCEGNSALPNLMHGVNFACDNFARELLARNSRETLRHDLMTATVDTYYQNANQPIALNMNKAWTQPYHLSLLPYLSDDPRIVITLRPIPEIVRSYVRIRQLNNDVLPERNLMSGEPIMSAVQGVANALQADTKMFLFGTYHQLTTDPQSFLNQVCDFWQIPKREWDFENIVNPKPENDAAFRTEGLHDVRPKLERRTYDVKVSKNLMKVAEELDEALWHDYEQAKQLRPESFIA